MDHIGIRRLEIYAYHGCLPEENELGQKFYVTADLYPAAGCFAESDLLEDSVNYDDVCRNIRKWMTDKRFRLIETCASYLAENILIHYPQLGRAHVTVEKPQVPVPYPVETVLASADRSWHRVYIGLGSNLGDRKEYLEKAIWQLNHTAAVKMRKLSSVYETEAYGFTDQPPFLNACAALDTWLSPEALLDLLHQIEASLGRVRNMHWGPRTIDLDILFYDREVIDTENLHIPHIDMANRLFVLTPLAEIAPFYRHPISQITVDEMLQNLQKSIKDQK